MSRLKEIQTLFYRSLFHDDVCPTDFICSSYPAERLNIYLQTVLEKLRNSLFITFPGIWELLGEACANSIANIFCKNHLPISGCLNDFGNQFPSFLGSVKELKNLPYLQDYAYYEWLQNKAYYAEQTVAITPSDLAKIPLSEIENIFFSFIPSFFTYTSEFPIQDIQNIVKNPNTSELSLRKSHSYSIVTRPKYEVLTIWITADLWDFIHYLEQGLCLSQVVHQTKKKHANFDLEQGIFFLLEKKLIKSINIK